MSGWHSWTNVYIDMFITNSVIVAMTNHNKKLFHYIYDCIVKYNSTLSPIILKIIKTYHYHTINMDWLDQVTRRVDDITRNTL